jgi:hypothetical protein
MAVPKAGALTSSATNPNATTRAARKGYRKGMKNRKGQVIETALA